MAGAAKTFRSVFASYSGEVTNWFPGHMAKGVKQMQRKLRSVDCIIEVHDSRIPIAGRNPNFYHMLTAVRPHLLVLNKMDLTDMRYRKEIKTLLRDKMDDSHVVFVNCKDQGNPGVAEVIPKTIELIKSSDRFGREQVTEYQVMIIGVPNVGKSSLINSLRNLHLKKGNATRVGASPGVTRSVLEKIKISDEPTVYLLDTPGVLQPSIRDVDTSMKLALCATIDDKMVGIIRMADYLLFWLNRHRHFSYVDFLGLQEPNDDINEVLLHTAMSLKLTKIIRQSDGSRLIHPDMDAASSHFVRAFQAGKLGKFMFDSDLIENNLRRANEGHNRSY